MNEQGQITHKGTVIPYTVIRSKRRHKTIQIVLDPLRGVVVASPMRVAKAYLRQLVEKRAGWIVQRIHRITPRVSAETPRGFVTGESVLYLGERLPLAVEPGAVSRVLVTLAPSGLTFTVPGGLDGDQRRTAVEVALTSWYRKRALEDVTRRVRLWELPVEMSPKAVLVRDQRRRWGSCSPDGTLRFNWRLIMAPPDIIDYVVVHELCHLKVRNHSAAYWAEVTKVLPDWKLRRKALNELGPSLVV